MGSLVTCNKGFVGTNDKSMKSYALKLDVERCGCLGFDNFDEY